MVAEPRAQEVDEPEPELGVDGAIDGGGDRMVDRAVEQGGAHARLRQPVAMDGGHPPVADVERQPVRVESHPDVPLPEVAAPAIVVSPDHHDRHPPAEPGQRGRHVEAAARDDPAVGEPEVEQVAVDEQAIAQVGDRLEKRQQRLLDRGRRSAEVGVGHDDERMAQHGAKDGPLRPAWQPRPGCHGIAPPSVTNPERPA